jgi:hypothetical protein
LINNSCCRGLVIKVLVRPEDEVGCGGVEDVSLELGDQTVDFLAAG